MLRYFDNRGVMADNIFGKFGLNGIQWKPQKQDRERERIGMLSKRHMFGTITSTMSCVWQVMDNFDYDQLY